MRKKWFLFALSLPALLLLAIFIYYLPPVHVRLAWRVEEQITRLKYALHPPERAVFVPQAPDQVTQVVALLSPTPTISPTATSFPTQAGPVSTPTETVVPTPTATPLPAKVMLSGVKYEDQHGRWNYCAPANLSMALSFWGWQGSRDVVGPVLKPDDKDKNVMPYEMATYVEGNTSLKVVSRLAGDPDLLKRFIAAGFPVLIEKGVYLRDFTGVNSWMGHYAVVTGYDDSQGVFITQDSFLTPDYKVAYEQLVTNWRSFNYTYLVIFPPEREAEVLALLGPDADENENYRHAAQRASDEIYATSGIDQFFAWFNRGSSLVQLQDYGGAAQAYDEAFTLYPQIPEKERPWRMLWYQTGPYFAYFYVGRYYDVLSLADTTLNAMQSDKNLEESYYWRAMAKSALGDTTGAIEDYRLSLQYHAGFGPAVYQLNVLGVETP